MAGCIVLSVGLFGHMEGMDMAGELKRSLDRLHFEKIRISDAIFVLNKDGYIGLSTWDEIFFAISNHVSIFFLEPLKGECVREFKRILDMERIDASYSLGAKSGETVIAVLFLLGNERFLEPVQTEDVVKKLLPFCG